MSNSYRKKTYYFGKYNDVNSLNILTYSKWSIRSFHRSLSKFVIRRLLRPSFREPDDCWFGLPLWSQHSCFLSKEDFCSFRALCFFHNHWPLLPNTKSDSLIMFLIDLHLICWTINWEGGSDYSFISWETENNFAQLFNRNWNVTRVSEKPNFYNNILPYPTSEDFSNSREW